MIKAGVIGATGYAGAEVVRLLTNHPGVELSVLTSRKYAGIRFDTVFPAMKGVVNLICEELIVEKLCKQTDVVFVALPHKLPMEIVPEIIDHGVKVIDLSADFRFSDPLLYETFYQAHTAKALLQKAVYGLSEVYGDKIKDAVLVGNPGCYPTSVLLPLVPLLKNNMLNTKTMIADSKSGVSGAGRAPALISHFCEANESFKAYKVADHRHNPEMNEVLSSVARHPVHITFVPHLIPMSRGMFTTIYADIIGNICIDDIYDCFATYYNGRKFIRICEVGTPPDTLHVRGTNYCDVGFKLENKRLIIMSAIDNLVKGASGQAVQNMNIMSGLEETTGLLNSPCVV